MTIRERSELVVRLAREPGFERAGIAPAEPPARLDYLNRWLAGGYAGEMDYLRRLHALRSDPAALLPGARSIIVVAHNYRQEPPSAPDEVHGPSGRVAQYAWGRDYHRVIRNKLRKLVRAMEVALGEPFGSRICVDTAPLVEREAAVAAGVGWIGKNTLVLHHELGSYFFLGAVLTTLDLATSKPVSDHCGSCTRCLEACPTGALIAPYQMDATRCISYLTIEHRGPIAEDLQPRMGDWVYGCDICQEVCPHNRRAPLTGEADYAPAPHNPQVPRASLEELAQISQEEYERAFAGSAMRRARLEMLQRNARIALENQRRPAGGTGCGHAREAVEKGQDAD